jgi:hypothetical protein
MNVIRMTTEKILNAAVMIPDPPRSSTLARQPRYDDLKAIVGSSLKWERKLFESLREPIN